MALSKIKKSFSRSATAALAAGALTFGAFSNASAGNDNNLHKAGYEQSPIAADYVTDCRSGNCAKTEAALWSMEPENNNGVGISVRLGTKEKLADTRIKAVLQDAFRKNGIENTKFFFEQNDADHTGIFFHVRGGTKGSYFVNRKIFEAVEDIAGLANNQDPVLALN